MLFIKNMIKSWLFNLNYLYVRFKEFFQDVFEVKITNKKK